jgi:hypothetical protein
MVPTWGTSNNCSLAEAALSPGIFLAISQRICCALVLFMLCALSSTFADGQVVVNTFEGIDASTDPHPELNIDPNGAVGTKQYMEWTNIAFQAWDKATHAPVWASPQVGILPWQQARITNCNISGDGFVIFDRIASRWVLGGHNPYNAGGNYYYCVAVSNTDDLSSPGLSWYTYRFFISPNLGTNAQGHTFFPDWPKLSTWIDGYYVAIDLLDPDNHYQPVGALVCALDRTNMLFGGSPRPMQCFTDPPTPPSVGRYLSHSLVPADVEGTMPPPDGRDEFLISLQNPPLDGVTVTSTALNLWDFHLDWDVPANSSFTNIALNVPSYEPGCYDLASVGNTYCVLELSPSSSGTGHQHVDSVGDRLMPRFAYRNFGSYESFLVSHTIRVAINAASTRTGVRWYELRGSGVPTLYQSGNVNPDTALYRTVPSIAQDQTGHAAVGYTVSSASVHPGIRASWWNLSAAYAPKEISLWNGTADEQGENYWGSYTSITVDPVDDCTFWYVDEYFATPQVGSSPNWNTRISNFKLPTCP